MTALDPPWWRKNLISLIESPSILVHVTGDRIGDALIKWPVIVALKKALPNHRLVWMAGRRGSVFRGALAPLASGVIDEVRDFANIGVRWREWLSPQPPGFFDIIIATEPKIRSALLLRRIKHNIFICPSWRFWLSDRRPSTNSPFPESAYAQWLSLASLAAAQELDVQPQVAIDQTLMQAAEAILPAGPIYVGLSPGASVQRKRWPVKNFIELAHKQAAQGRVPVIFLGPDEQDLYNDISHAVPAALFPERSAKNNPSGPLFTIALAQRLALSITNDSGGGHLLAAGGQPVVALFGHTSAKKFEPPYGKRHVVTAREFGSDDIRMIPFDAVDNAVERALAMIH